MCSHRIQRRQRGHAQRSKKQRATKIKNRALAHLIEVWSGAGLRGEGERRHCIDRARREPDSGEERSRWRGIC